MYCHCQWGEGYSFYISVIKAVANVASTDKNQPPLPLSPSPPLFYLVSHTYTLSFSFFLSFLFPLLIWEEYSFLTHTNGLQLNV